MTPGEAENISKTRRVSRLRRSILPIAALALGLGTSELLCRALFTSPFVARPIATGMLYHPRWGPIHEPGASYRSQNPADRSDFGMEINQLGFRGPEVGETSEEEFRLLFIGDSFTEGYGVEEEDGLVAQSERRFRDGPPAARVEAINAGIRGGAPSTYLRQIDRYLALAPDGIVLVAYDNDLADDFYYSTDLDHIRADVYNAIQIIPVESRLIETLAELYVRARRAWAVGRAQRLVKGETLRSTEIVYGSGRVEEDPHGFYVDSDPWQIHWDWSERHLSATADAAISRGVPFAIAYIPCPQTGIHGDCCVGLYPVQDGFVPGEHNPLRDWLRAFAERRDLPFIDVSETFLALAAEGDDALVYELANGHLNARGNSIVADLVYAALKHWPSERSRVGSQ